MARRYKGTYHDGHEITLTTDGRGYFAIEVGDGPDPQNFLHTKLMSGIARFFAKNGVPLSFTGAGVRPGGIYITKISDPDAVDETLDEFVAGINEKYKGRGDFSPLEHVPLQDVSVSSMQASGEQRAAAAEYLRGVLQPGVEPQEVLKTLADEHGMIFDPKRGQAR